MDLLQALISKVQVDLRHIKAFMAEKLAYEADIDAMINQVCGERVAESVRVDALEVRHHTHSLKDIAHTLVT